MKTLTICVTIIFIACVVCFSIEDMHNCDCKKCEVKK